MFFYSNSLLDVQNSRSGGISGTEEIRRTTQFQAESGKL